MPTARPFALLIYCLFSALVISANAASSMGDYGVSTTGYVQTAGISATNISATRITGDGSGLTNIGSNADRITSGTLAQVIAQTAGTVQISSTGLYVNNGGTNDAFMRMGASPSANRFAYLDLVGDTTYSTYGLRLIRGNTGANSVSYIQHRGTGEFALSALEAAPITFGTTSLERMRITAAGLIGIGTASPSNTLHVVGSMRVDGQQSNFNNTLNTSASLIITGDSALQSSVPFGDWQYNGQLIIRGSSNIGKHLALGVDTAASTMVSIIQSMESAVVARPLSLNPSGGYVGIATASPNATLEVNGTVSATDVTVNGASVGIPTGAIMAFDLTSCPTGWAEYTAARGRFLRGIDNGAGNDPNGTRAPGSTQADAFQGHIHASGIASVAGAIYNVSPRQEGGNGSTGVPITDGTNGTPRTSSETRPKNVAVLFCRKN